MHTSVVFVVLVLASISFAAPSCEITTGWALLDPCSVTLDNIHTDITAANCARKSCEQSYFTGDSCNDYWEKQDSLLTDTSNYAQCMENTELDFIHYLAGYSNGSKGAVEIQGEITRANITANAIATQNVVIDQNTQTRTTMTTEETKTRNNLTDLINAQSASTRANTTAEAAITDALLHTEETNTRTLVQLESNDTRTTVIAQATSTRSEVDDQGASTRATVHNESDVTRALITAESNQTRTFIHSEAVTTRATVSTEATATRAEIDTQANATRTTVAAQSEQTRQFVVTETTATIAEIDSQHVQTRQLITTETNVITANLTQVIAVNAAATQTVVRSTANDTNTLIINTAANIQNTQINFTTLYLQSQMESSCSSNNRIDLFQRPAADGGYYETFRALVGSVCTYNNQKYGDQGQTGNLNAADSKASQKSYRLAWSYLCDAYVGCVSPGIF